MKEMVGFALTDSDPTKSMIVKYQCDSDGCDKMDDNFSWIGRTILSVASSDVLAAFSWVKPLPSLRAGARSEDNNSYGITLVDVSVSVHMGTRFITQKSSHLALTVDDSHSRVKGTLAYIAGDIVFLMGFKGIDDKNGADWIATVKLPLLVSVRGIAVESGYVFAVTDTHTATHTHIVGEMPPPPFPSIWVYHYDKKDEKNKKDKWIAFDKYNNLHATRIRASKGPIIAFTAVLSDEKETLCIWKKGEHTLKLERANEILDFCPAHKWIIWTARINAVWMVKVASNDPDATNWGNVIFSKVAYEKLGLCTVLADHHSKKSSKRYLPDDDSRKHSEDYPAFCYMIGERKGVVWYPNGQGVVKEDHTPLEQWERSHAEKEEDKEKERHSVEQIKEEQKNQATKDAENKKNNAFLSNRRLRKATRAYWNSLQDSSSPEVGNYFWELLPPPTKPVDWEDNARNAIIYKIKRINTEIKRINTKISKVKNSESDDEKKRKAKDKEKQLKQKADGLQEYLNRKEPIPMSPWLLRLISSMKAAPAEEMENKAKQKESENKDGELPPRDNEILRMERQAARGRYRAEQYEQDRIMWGRYYLRTHLPHELISAIDEYEKATDDEAKKKAKTKFQEVYKRLSTRESSFAKVSAAASHKGSDPLD